MDEMIDTDLGPPMWQTHRWSCVDLAVDWNLFWGCCHFLLEGVREVVFAVKDATRRAAAEEARGCEPGILALEDGEDDEQGAGDGDDDERHHMPEQDLGMPDPVKDQTHHERQSTFRANCVVWLRSRPLGRLWCLKVVIHVQQNAQRELVKCASKAWSRKELIKRSKGEKPSTRSSLPLRGIFIRKIWPPGHGR